MACGALLVVPVAQCASPSGFLPAMIRRSGPKRHAPCARGRSVRWCAACETMIAYRPWFIQGADCDPGERMRSAQAPRNPARMRDLSLDRVLKRRSTIKRGTALRQTHNMHEPRGIRLRARRRARRRRKLRVITSADTQHSSHEAPAPVRCDYAVCARLFACGIQSSHAGTTDVFPLPIRPRFFKRSRIAAIEAHPARGCSRASRVPHARDAVRRPSVCKFAPARSSAWDCAGAIRPVPSGRAFAAMRAKSCSLRSNTQGCAHSCAKSRSRDRASLHGIVERRAIPVVVPASPRAEADAVDHLVATPCCRICRTAHRSLVRVSLPPTAPLSLEEGRETTATMR